MKALFVLPVLALFPACSGGIDDTCGIAGEWLISGYTVAGASRNGLISGDLPADKLFYRDDEPVTFTDDGLIVGGSYDGIEIGGGQVATQWACEGNERVILSAPGNNPIGPSAVRTRILKPSVFEYMGDYRYTYVRYDGSKEAARANFISSLENIQGQ